MSATTDQNRPGSKTVPIVLGVIAGVLLIAVVITLTIYLQRSAPAAEPAPAASSSTSADQPAAPAQPAPSSSQVAATSAVEITGDGFTITQADGSEFAHAWADDAPPAIEALTELLGSEPAEDFQNGDSENYAYNIYEWGGVRLYDVFLSAGNRPRAEVPAPTYLALTSPAPEGVAFSDEFGLEIGMTMDEARALGPDSDAAPAGGGAQLVFGADRGTFYSDGVRSFSAFVNSDASGETVASITYTFNTGSR